jgi:hypothetical protein
MLNWPFTLHIHTKKHFKTLRPWKDPISSKRLLKNQRGQCLSLFLLHLLDFSYGCVMVQQVPVLQ